MSDTQTATADSKDTKKVEQPAAKGPCGCMKKPQTQTVEQKQIVDPAEPKLNFFHQLRIAYAVGFTWIFIFFGGMFYSCSLSF